ncbi:O-fucosyltransferase family protein [Terriglobus albidus]|uniref:hypothetical protein n=1 Tax=Terriglobus albidus TaxID=1592106 RepID=UPI0021E0E09B|nr:hypothetical protein [Terriglobus albidus]
MRFVVARRTGRRGEGLGNEIMAWSKGYIASQVLGAKLIGPGWGINARRYYRNFQTSRFDFVLEDLLYRLATYRFEEADYRASGELNFGAAIEKWSQEKHLDHRSSFIVSVGGMYGGYLAIRDARPFIWQKLLGSKNALSNIYRVTSRLDPGKLFVAVHMRVGNDFQDPGATSEFRGRFNMKLPLEWYLNICESLSHTFKDKVQFHFFTDRQGPEFQEAVARFNPGQEGRPELSETSDLALMAMADFRICSVSSYSLVASFLSGGLYAWYEPQLSLLHEAYTLWGHETSQQMDNSPTRLAYQEACRAIWEKEGSGIIQGWPISLAGKLPPGLVHALEHKLASANQAFNLLSYGVVPKKFTVSIGN